MWAALGRWGGRGGGREGGRERIKTDSTIACESILTLPSLPPPSLPSPLGDLTNDEGGCYEKAWVLSKGRYARAKRSLGRRAFREVRREEGREGRRELRLVGAQQVARLV